MFSFLILLNLAFSMATDASKKRLSLESNRLYNHLTSPGLAQLRLLSLECYSVCQLLNSLLHYFLQCTARNLLVVERKDAAKFLKKVIIHV